MRHTKLTAVTAYPNTGWPPKCGNQDFKVEHHSTNESFLAGSQFSEPNKKIKQPANDRMLDLLIDNIAYWHNASKSTKEDAAKEYAMELERKYRNELKVYLAQNYIRCNEIFNRA